MVYGDRKLSQTLARALNPLSYYQKMRIGLALSQGIQEAKKTTREDIDELMNDSDQIYEFIAEMGNDFPQFSKALLDERNVFMAGNLQRSALKHKTIVAVM